MPTTDTDVSPHAHPVEVWDERVDLRWFSGRVRVACRLR